jgi:uncharacterized protein YjbJ (UPF0337 family)
MIDCLLSPFTDVILIHPSNPYKSILSFSPYSSIMLRLRSVAIRSSSSLFLRPQTQLLKPINLVSFQQFQCGHNHRGQCSCQVSQFSTLSSRLNELKSDLKAKASEVRGKYQEVKGDIKENLAGATETMKDKLQAAEANIKNKVEAIDSKLQDKLDESFENLNQRASAQTPSSAPSSAASSAPLPAAPNPSSLAKRSQPQPLTSKQSDNIQRRYFSTRRSNNVNDNNYSGRIEPGSMVEGLATENKNIGTTANPSMNDESINSRKYKQALDSYNTVDDGQTATAIDNETLGNAKDKLADAVNLATQRAQAVLNDVREKSYEMQDSLPTIDTEAIKNKLRESAGGLKQAVNKLSNSEISNNLKDKASGLADKAKATLSSVASKLGAGDDLPQGPNTSAATPQQIQRYEQEMRFGQGRNALEENNENLSRMQLEEREEDDAINPADINLAPESGDINVELNNNNRNIDVQSPDGIATAPDTNIDSESVKQKLAGEDLSEIENLANQERFGNLKHVNSMPNDNKNSSKFPSY